MIYTDQMRRNEGVRIVRLRDRTQPHRANLKDDYTVIKKAAENRKKEDAIEKWVNATIPSAYVRIDEKYSRCDYLYNW
jgi:peptidyl-prolyl cis-trans isomerase SurA